MALANITKDGVEATIREYDALGTDAFLAQYGFSNAKRYWILHDGKTYPSKAIAGVAHKYVTGEPLPSSSFTGGEGSVVRKLKSLGFKVQGSVRNPDWTRDELILALDLYLTSPASPPGKESRPVQELSALLNKLHRLNGSVASDTLRNPNGVYMKMMNLRALDPTFTALGKVGMKSGGSLERVIWAEYAGRREALATDAKALRTLLASTSEDALDDAPPAELYEGEEGGVTMRLHRRYERDARLVAEKRKAALATGSLACEVCEFDFRAVYGELGAGFIEVHHLTPVHVMKPGAKTKLADLALLCSNCHRMAHRRRTPLSLSELKVARTAAKG